MNDEISSANLLVYCGRICVDFKGNVSSTYPLFKLHTTSKSRSTLTHTHKHVKYIYSTYTIPGINHNFLAIKTKPQRFAALLKLMMKRESIGFCVPLLFLFTKI